MSKATRQDRFRARVDEHKKILFKVASSYCRNPIDREDLIQEMLLQIWRSFDRYDERRRFSTWLYRVALNVAISAHRKETRRSRAIVAVDDSILEIAAEAPKSAALERDLKLLRQFLERLDELDRALVILYLDGNRYETIAEILGISETNVGTKISRIKRRLKRDRVDDTTKERAHGTR